MTIRKIPVKFLNQASEPAYIYWDPEDGNKPAKLTALIPPKYEGAADAVLGHKFIWANEECTHKLGEFRIVADQAAYVLKDTGMREPVELLVSVVKKAGPADCLDRHQNCETMGMGACT